MIFHVVNRWQSSLLYLHFNRGNETKHFILSWFELAVVA